MSSAPRDGPVSATAVLVLEHGRIVEDGAPDDLIGRAGGRYAAAHCAWVESLA